MIHHLVLRVVETCNVYHPSHALFTLYSISEPIWHSIFDSNLQYFTFHVSDDFFTKYLSLSEISARHLRHKAVNRKTGRHLEASASGGIWNHLQASGGKWKHLEPSGGIWEASGRHLGGIWSIWKASGRHPGSIWEACGTPGGHGAPARSKPQKPTSLSARTQKFHSNVTFYTLCF